MRAEALVLLALFTAWRVVAATYHVDSQTGEDARDGLTPATAWRSLKRVNAAVFTPGDGVCFRRGSVWTEPLIISARGEPGRPVMFAAYGDGARPRIDTAAFTDAVLLTNAQHVAVRDFEVTNRGNDGKPRRGVHIVADNCGTLTNIVVADLFIHDVEGTNRDRDNGGIIYRAQGERVPSRFDGLRIERNIVWRVDRTGITCRSYHWKRTLWFPSTNVVIRDNWVGDVGGDGIVPWASDGCLVEHNIVQGANERARTHNAGIWPWSTDNTVLRLNRASGVKTLLDGQGFDSDYNSRNTVLEYNLSHDNEGGFLLVCASGNRKTNENLGNLGTIARFNISRYDHARGFKISAVEDVLLHNNALYIGPTQDVQAVLVSDWSGWVKGLTVSNNLFCAEGVARYGYARSKDTNGVHAIAAGWGAAKDVVFLNNRYVGRHEKRPDKTDASTSAPQPIRFDDWPGPQFDPRQPETFSAYIQAHREWMLRLMERQFGRRPQFAGIPPR